MKSQKIIREICQLVIYSLLWHIQLSGPSSFSLFLIIKDWMTIYRWQLCQENLNCHLNIRLYRSKCFGKSSEEWSHGNYRSILSISPNGNSFSASYIYIPCAVLVCYFQSQRLSRIPLRTGPQCDNNHTLHNCCHSISKGSY